ncbi:glutamine amidotransferase, partial [Klebsiella variicola]|nr:glutamine amidotransferase [Klebsiella variicola]
MTRKRFLLVQTGTPPAAIREEPGDLTPWYRTKLARWQAQLTAEGGFEDA